MSEKIKLDGVPFLPTKEMIRAGANASSVVFGREKEELTAIFCAMMTALDAERKRDAR